MAVTFTLNGKSTTVEVDPQMPLLWVLRDTLNMTGTKFGCGMALCGACTVHINGEATRSCITTISSVAGKKITTISDFPRIRVTRLSGVIRIQASNGFAGFFSCSSARLVFSLASR